VREGEVWLFNAHISPYSHGNRENHDPMRTASFCFIGAKYQAG
jgi:tmRNA-binding protein